MKNTHREGLRATASTVLPAIFLCALFAAVGVMHATARLWGVRAGYRLSQLEQEGRKLSREHDRLKLELATLKNPVRLDRLAKEKLGMGPLAPGALISLGDSAPKPAPSTR
jgi:cell division protein FtsL